MWQQSSALQNIQELQSDKRGNRILSRDDVDGSYQIFRIFQLQDLIYSLPNLGMLSQNLHCLWISYAACFETKIKKMTRGTKI